MPGLADFEVPSFIKPPSPAEAQQLAMERERLAIASQEAADKMFERMQRRVAFTKMMGESKTMQASGVDPMTARSQAFLNNADKLYMGDPDGYQRATDAVQGAMDQRAAQREFQDYMQQRIKDGVDPGDALFEGWSKFGPRISKTAFSGYTGAYLRGQSSAATLAERQRESEAKMGLEREKMAAQADAAQARLDAAAAKRSPALTEATDLADAQAKLKTLPPGPERDRQQIIVDDMLARHSEQQIEVTSTPGGGTTTRITRVPSGKQATPGALTTAEQTRYGEDVQASANSLRVLNSLQNKIDSGTVGALPAINTVLFDEVLGQFAPDLVNQHRAASRQNIGIATQQVLGELNNRGRFSNMELQAIKGLMPELGGMESAARSQVKLRELRKMLAEKGANAAVTLKRPIPSEIVSTLSEMSDQALVDEFKSGAISNDIFWQIYNSKHPQGATQPAKGK